MAKGDILRQSCGTATLQVNLRGKEGTSADSCIDSLVKEERKLDSK